MYSSDFDYDGMLRKGSRVTVKTNLTSLNKLHDSFEDVGYHTQGRLLTKAIEQIEAGLEMKSTTAMGDFNQSCRNEMREQGIKF